MNYEQEIVIVLAEAGSKGLSVKKISKHVFNSCNGLFDVVSYDEVRQNVASYLSRYSKKPDSLIEHTGARGVYRLKNQPKEARQLMLEFTEEEQQEEKSKVFEEDRSLSLF